METSTTVSTRSFGLPIIDSTLELELKPSSNIHRKWTDLPTWVFSFESSLDAQWKKKRSIWYQTETFPSLRRYRDASGSRIKPRPSVRPISKTSNREQSSQHSEKSGGMHEDRQTVIVSELISMGSLRIGRLPRRKLIVVDNGIWVDRNKELGSNGKSACLMRKGTVSAHSRQDS